MIDIIEVEGLSKTYSTGKGRPPLRAVDGIEFTVREGEVLGFLGPNGAGKTTTIRMLTGLSRPTAGAARLLGLDLAHDLPRINLPDAAVDFIWAAFVFHEVEPPAALAAEMRRVLRPGGRIAVLDWRPDARGESGPPRHHRLSPQQVEGFLRQAGFGSLPQTWQDEDAYLICAGQSTQKRGGTR